MNGDLVAFRVRPTPEELTARVSFTVYLGILSTLFGGFLYAYLDFVIVNPRAQSPERAHLPTALGVLCTLSLAVCIASCAHASNNVSARTIARALGVTIAGAAAFFATMVATWLHIWQHSITRGSAIFVSIFLAASAFHAVNVVALGIGAARQYLRARRGELHARNNYMARLWSRFAQYLGAIWLLLWLGFYLA